MASHFLISVSASPAILTAVYGDNTKKLIHQDENPFTKGWFGFRTVRNHVRIDNFRIYQLAAKK